MSNKINFWGLESFIYPLLDVAGLEGQSEIEKEFNLGADHKVNIIIKGYKKSHLRLRQRVGTFKITLQFTHHNNKWLRIDNDHYGLHAHYEDENRPFKHHRKLSEDININQLISNTFEFAKKLVKKYYPKIIIEEGEGFVGWVGPEDLKD